MASFTTDEIELLKSKGNEVRDSEGHDSRFLKTKKLMCRYLTT